MLTLKKKALKENEMQTLKKSTEILLNSLLIPGLHRHYLGGHQQLHHNPFQVQPHPHGLHRTHLLPYPHQYT